VIAGVGEGMVSTIGSADSHKGVLENPDHIPKHVLAKGLDAGTIGATRQIAQANAHKQIAQANAEQRPAMAVAEEQEMRASGPTLVPAPGARPVARHGRRFPLNSSAERRELVHASWTRSRPHRPRPGGVSVCQRDLRFGARPGTRKGGWPCSIHYSAPTASTHVPDIRHVFPPELAGPHMPEAQVDVAKTAVDQEHTCPLLADGIGERHSFRVRNQPVVSAVHQEQPGREPRQILTRRIERGEVPLHGRWQRLEEDGNRSRSRLVANAWMVRPSAPSSDARSSRAAAELASRRSIIMSSSARSRSFTRYGRTERTSTN
jgi:hypothetical protein